MPIQLFSNLNTLLDHLPADDGETLRVVLTEPDGEMAEDLALDDPGLLIVDVTGPKLQRVNFDLVRFAVIDLTPKTLLGSGGRRLMDVLGHLALEELTLAFVGPATAVTGGILEDGITAGLNLLPRTAVLADVQSVADLRGLLTALSQAGRRILALDGAVMNYILGGEDGPWDDLFDLVICSARKPGFFLPKGKGERVPADTVPHLPNRRGHCFTGGDAFYLESKLGAIGDAILYFGDHTYGDILRSKKSVGWRTAMIVPEVEEEILAAEPLRGTLADLEEIEDSLEDLGLERDHLLSVPDHDPVVVQELQDRIGRAVAKAPNPNETLMMMNPLAGDTVDELPSRVYAHAGLTLYVLDTITLAQTRIGDFTNLPANQTMLDLAVDRDDRMIGITRDKIFEVDEHTAAATLLATFGTASNFLSLIHI